MNWVKKSRTCFIVFLFTALIIHCISTSTKHIQGDGYEYLLMSQSVVNHFSFDLRRADLDAIEYDMSHYADTDLNASNIFSAYRKMLLDSADGVMGYFKSRDGAYYSYHFWMYPLVNAPAFWLTHLLHCSPVRSFHITNIGIVIITLLFLTQTLLLSRKERYFITAFYVFCGTTYYVGWSHPEVFCGSLFLIGLILLLHRRFLLSAFLMALAAQQNPPIGIVAGVALGLQTLFIIQHRRVNRKGFWRCLHRFLPVVLIGGVLLLSPIFYYLHFKTFNIILKIGGANNHLISLDRLYSLYFDLNQGMIVAIPFVLILLAALLIGYCLYLPFCKNLAVKKKFLLSVFILSLSILIAIPSLSTTNWNSGCAIFLRYVYWISMPIGVAVMLLIATLSTRLYVLAFTFFFMGQLWILFVNGITGKEDSFFYKAPVNYLLNHKAAWYNPIPVIFMERGLHKARALDANTIYFYVNSHFEVTKLLYHANNKAVFPPCQHLSLAEMERKINVVITEGGWRYLNPPSGFCKTHLNEGFYCYPESGF